jgi:Holliday junction resolvase RusA-like endonuclease
MITFEVPGSPIPKARARTLRNGHSYTPKTTEQYEIAIAEAAMVAGVKLKPGHVGYVLGVRFFISSYFWQKDLSNLKKAAEDGLQRYGKAHFGWDDGQIVGYTEWTRKVPCAKGEERTVVKLWEALM